MRSLIHFLPTFPATLATPQSAAAIAGCDRLRPILDSQIPALVNRIGASPRSVQVRVERILSDWCARKQRLAQNGASYDL